MKAVKKTAKAAEPPFSVRFPKDVRKALEEAAKADMRPVSHMVQKIVADWLKERGFMK